MKISLFDICFAHHSSGQSSELHTTDKFEWDRQGFQKVGVFTDFQLAAVERCGIAFRTKIAWILEPYEISIRAHQYLKHNIKLFDYVMTSLSKDLFEHEYGKDMLHKYIYLPYGDSWVSKENQKLHQKTKNISFISSIKTQTTNHQIRVSLKDRIANLIGISNCFGELYNRPIHDKLDSLKEYQFQIVIENTNQDGFFSEKTLDCLVTGTVPIYIGGKHELLDRCVKYRPEMLLQDWLDIRYPSHEFLNESLSKAQKYLCKEERIYEALVERNVI